MAAFQPTNGLYLPSQAWKFQSQAGAGSLSAATLVV